MFSVDTISKFTNGFTGVTSYESDTILWVVFIAVMGILCCTAYFANRK